MPEVTGAPTTPNQKSVRASRHVFAEPKDRMGCSSGPSDRESEDEDWTGEPRLQYQTPALLRRIG